MKKRREIMRKSLKFDMCLILFLGFNLALYAQVGIKTENPQGVFHIDGQGNTNGNLNRADDVIITQNGDVGIGTVPSSRLDIKSSSFGAFRLEDGSEGPGKVLSCVSADGKATWANLPGSWYASLTGGNLPYTNDLSTRKVEFTGGQISSAQVGGVDVVSGRITVPYTGIYRLTISANSLMDRSAGGYIIKGYYPVRKVAGGTIWAPHSMGDTRVSTEYYVSYTSLYTLNANDVLEIFSNEGNPGYANAVDDLIFLVEFVQ